MGFKLDPDAFASSKFRLCRYRQRSESACAEARAAGMEVVVATATTLLIDLDSAAAIHHYEQTFNNLADALSLFEDERWVSKSGRGRHVVVRLLSPLPVIDRIALQAALGSDPFREVLHWAAFHRGDEPCIVLFRPRPR